MTKLLFIFLLYCSCLLAAEQQTAVAVAAEPISKDMIEVTGKVLSVASNGVMLTEATVGMAVMKDVAVSWNPLDGTPKYERQSVIEAVKSKDAIFVYGVTGLSAGASYSGKVFATADHAADGNAASGGSVKAFAVTKALAEKHGVKPGEVER